MLKNIKLLIALVSTTAVFYALGIIIDTEVKSIIILFLFYGLLIATIQHIAGTLFINNDRNELLYLAPVVIDIIIIAFLINSFYNATGVLGGLAEYALIYSFASATMYNFVLYFILVKE